MATHASEAADRRIRAHIVAERSLVDSLLDIERELLPLDMRQNELVEWVIQHDRRLHEVGFYLTPASSVRTRGRASRALDKAIDSAFQYVIPFYATSLRYIGYHRRTAERLLGQLSTALSPANLAASADATRASAEAIRASWPHGALLPVKGNTGLAAQRAQLDRIIDASPQAREDALKEILLERRDHYSKRLAESLSWWRTWQTELEPRRLGLQLLHRAQHILAGYDPGVGWRDEDLERAWSQVWGPSVLRDQLAREDDLVMPVAEIAAQPLLDGGAIRNALRRAMTRFESVSTPNVLDKPALIERVARRLGVSDRDSASGVNAVLEAIRESLIAGEMVDLPKLGVLHVENALTNPNFPSSAASEENMAQSQRRVAFTPASALFTTSDRQSPDMTPPKNEERHGAPFDQAYLITPSRLIGRDSELGWLVDRLCAPGDAGDDNGVTAISGVGGIGKSALVGAAVNRARKRGRLKDGVVVIVCQGMTDARTLLRRALAKFDPWRRRPEAVSLDELAEVARRLLAGKDALIVLDDIEAGLDLNRIITPLRMAGARLVLISRHRVPEDVVPAESQRQLDCLPLAEAEALFAQAMGRVSLEGLEPAERAAAQRLIVMLGRHTLGLQVTGAYAGSTGAKLQDLSTELSEPLPSMAVSESEDIPSGLGLVLTRSVEELPQDAQRLFVALGAFATVEFGRQAALSVGQALGLANLGANIELLVRRSMLHAYRLDRMPDKCDRERLRLHPLMYARGRYMLTDWPETDRFSSYMAVARYFAAYMRDVEERALSSDKGNIAGALEWAIQHGQDDLALALCSDMRAFWYNRWHISDALRYLPLGIAAGERLMKSSTAQEARSEEIRKELAYVALTYAQALRRVGRLEEAESALRTNLAVRHEIQDRWGEAAVLSQLGIVIRIRGHMDEAEECLRQSLQIRQEVGDPQGEALDLSQLGRIAQARGQMKDAVKLFRQSLQLARRANDRRTYGDVLAFLGQIARGRGRLARAERYLKESLKIMEEEEDRRGQCVALHELGQIDRMCGRLDEAERHFAQCLQINRDLRDRRGEGKSLGYLGRVCKMRGRLEEAREHFRQSLDIAKEVRDRRGEGIVLSQYGQIALMGDDIASAKEYFAASLRIRQEVQDRKSEGADLGYLARIALIEGDLAEAERLLKRNLAIARETEDKQGQSVVLALLAQMAGRRGELDTAEQRFQESLSLAQDAQSKPTEAETRFALGIFKAEHRGESEEARAILKQAIESFAEMGVSQPPRARQRAEWLGLL